MKVDNRKHKLVHTRVLADGGKYLVYGYIGWRGAADSAVSIVQLTYIRPNGGWIILGSKISKQIAKNETAEGRARLRQAWSYYADLAEEIDDPWEIRRIIGLEKTL